MFKDEMTPKERMEAFSKGEEMDRIPVVPDMGVTMSDFLGYKTWDYYSNCVHYFKRNGRSHGN